jgi:hypothetical protein
MNLIFGNTPESQKYWDKYLRDDIRRNFVKVSLKVVSVLNIQGFGQTRK